MRNWNTAADLQLLDHVMRVLRSGGCLQPGDPFEGDPVDLQGLTFPTLAVRPHPEAPFKASVQSGRQEVTAAILRRIDLFAAKLDHLAWIKCRFDHVRFDSARLQGARFFGCSFFDCTFTSTSLRDAAFSVAPDGTETILRECTLTKTDLKHASTFNVIFNNVKFIDCQLRGFDFNQPLCEKVEFVGKYDELTFKGMPRGGERNRLGIDLHRARVGWLHANHGLNLRSMILPEDGSCFIVTNRKSSIEYLCSYLSTQMPTAKVLAKILRGIFSDRSISPLSPDQETFLLSRGMVLELDDSLSEQEAAKAFQLLRHAAQEQGYLLEESDKETGAGSHYLDQKPFGQST
jgi:hypothetical protein